MKENPNAAWENCDFYFWPAWYFWASWASIISAFAFGAYCIFVKGL